MTYFRQVGDGVCLTHWGRVTHICVVELGHHWFRQWLVACSAPSHYLNQCWNVVDIVNCTFTNKLQWFFYRDSNIFIQEIVFENAVCKMASILSRPQWVNTQNGRWRGVVRQQAIAWTDADLDTSPMIVHNIASTSLTQILYKHK